MYVRRREYSLDHWRRLAALPSQGVGVEHAARALALWARLTYEAPLEPHIEPTPDGAVMFGWTNGRAVVTISLHASGRCDWSCEGEDAPRGGTVQDTALDGDLLEEISHAIGAITHRPALSDAEIAGAQERARDDDGNVSPYLFAAELGELDGVRQARAIAATADAAFWEARRAR